ncbi:MAG TPA: fibrillarin-like rRNA/tRNA 2'-O-methyltransferase [Nitrososphaerales archaeon]|nr:fibrillarin-like rRNA/tRNA 2'-O-methyltransferase [Nitrososphaerales archaeon]
MKPLIREDRSGRTFLLTRNLAKGRRVYNEELVLKEGEEYRTWDPFRSKLAAAILKGLPEDVIRPGEKVLYLGTSTGTTPSHVSDIVGEEGLLIGVEFAPRVAREFIENVARHRKNVIPFVADAREPSKYSLSKVDVVYCDIAQPDQTEIAIKNCDSLLKGGGRLLLVVKARSIDVLDEPARVFKQEVKKIEAAGFKVMQVIELSPFEKDHALIYALRPS